MSTERRRCWSCGVMFYRSDRYCPECGKDNWNPPQGQNATRSYSPVGSTATYRSESPATMDHHGQTIAAGIVIIATLLAFSFWFSVCLGAIGLFVQPDNASVYVGDPVATNYFTGLRLFWALFGSVILTVLTWVFAIRSVED